MSRTTTYTAGKRYAAQYHHNNRWLNIKFIFLKTDVDKDGPHIITKSVTVDGAQKNGFWQDVNKTSAELKADKEWMKKLYFNKIRGVHIPK